MARDFRILHLADSHIGADLPARPRSTRRRRGDDIIASYRRALAFAAEENVDLVIHAGDVFDLPTPNNAALAAAAEPLLELAASGVPVVVIPGNHERATLPASLLFSHPDIHVVRHPRTLNFSLRGTRVAVAAIPCIRRDAAQRFSDAVQATGWQRARADVNLLVAHQTFESARCGPVGYRFRSGDDVVERDAIPAEFDYVAAGHIHRHQVLATPHEAGPPIVYAGSPDRISFAERDEPKGAVLIEAAGGVLTHRFVEYPVRPMLLVPMNVSGCDSTQIREQALERIVALPADAVTLLRLSGQTIGGALRGLELTRHAREARPDVLLTVSSQAIEFVPERQIRRAATRPAASAFAQLDAPRGEVITAAASHEKRLTKTCGTYALYDKLGRLLYVGKAKNIRTRVRAHVAARYESGHFAGWTREIARADARRAYSELEALLVEAELIRKLRPPFNRQMRLWSRYCYLCENGEPHNQLQISREPGRKGVCFGPFRSRGAAREVRDASAALLGLALCPPGERPVRTKNGPTSSSAANLCQRYFSGLCSGPCAKRVSPTEYRERINQRNALLTGRSNDALLSREHANTAVIRSTSSETAKSDTDRWIETLRSAFAYTRTLRRAEALLGSVLLLPGPHGARTAVALASDGVYLDLIIDDAARADRILANCRKRLGATSGGGSQRLPKAVTDCLCTVVRQLRRDADSCSLIPAGLVTTLDGQGLLALAGSLRSPARTADYR